MLASIEARMRRLNKMAQNTYLSLSATKQSLPAPDHKTSATPQAQSCASPIPPLDQEQQLPEWKFFNKVHVYILVQIRVMLLEVLEKFQDHDHILWYLLL